MMCLFNVLVGFDLILGKNINGQGIFYLVYEKLACNKLV